MPATITHKGVPVALPDALKNSHLMRYARLGGKFSNFTADPAGEAVTLVCAILDLKGDPITHADDLPPLVELVEALGPLLSTLGEKKAPAAGASPLPAPGTPGA